MAHLGRSARHPRGLRVRRGRGHLLRLLPGPQGGGPRPHRSLEVRMNRLLRLLGLMLIVAPSATLAQTYTPQSPAGLSVTFTTERAGGTRVLVFGEVRNSNPSSAQRVVVLVEGLDEAGRVVSRGRGYVQGVIPSRGSAPFEIRMLASGSEKRYRTQIESFEFAVGGGGIEPRGAQSP